jgi:hypothetical protein
LNSNAIGVGASVKRHDKSSRAQADGVAVKRLFDERTM